MATEQFFSYIMTTEQFFSYIMTRTSYILMTRFPLCTRPHAY